MSTHQTLLTLLMAANVEAAPATEPLFQAIQKADQRGGEAVCWMAGRVLTRRMRTGIRR